MGNPARPVLAAIVALFALSAGTCAERAEPRGDRVTAGASGEQMASHFEESLAIRDALIGGDLETARRRARALTEWKASDLRAEAAGYVTEFRAAAQAVMDAPDRGTLARAVGRLAASCGDCHRGSNVRVELEPAASPAAEPGAVAHMRRHLWAADRLWEGLIVPSDDAWGRGTEALATVALRPETLSPDLPLYPRVEALAQRVHALAEEGSRTADTGARIDVYGGVLATCARCHGLLAE